MYFVCFLIFIMAGLGFDDDDFSLSGLTQEGHELDVTVISCSSDEDSNYGGLLECARKLAGISDKMSSVEGGVQAGVEPAVEPGVEPVASNIPISKTANSGIILSSNMASSLSQSQQSIDVSFMHFYLV